MIYRKIRKVLVIGMVLALVALVFTALPMNVAAEYTGNVTIYSDGSYTSGAPLSVSGSIYTLTDDISGMVRVQMSGITLDGAGYTVEGSGGGPGILMIGLTGVTLKGLNVRNFGIGMVIVNCDGCTIKENSVSDCVDAGIYLTGSDENTVKDNELYDNVWEGLWLENSDKNIVKDNEAWGNDEAGIFLWYYCDYNIIKDNYCHDNGATLSGSGIFLIYYCNNNLIKQNDVSDKNTVGIVLDIESNNNIVTENSISNNDAGGIYVLGNSNNNMITKNTIFKCYTYGQCGIRIFFSGGNTVSQNSVSKCYRGLLVVFNPTDNGNIITKNTFSDNYRGLHFAGGGNNVIHHNNIVRNTKQVQDGSAGNQYDDGSEGNYWSDYKGKDTNSDGVGDTDLPHNGLDNYPLMSKYA
jgi:parallel beta-helix repeat protein